jgi:Bacteriophage probable baseplate hub protein
VADAAVKSGLPQTDYYAPAFKIVVEGTDLAPETLREILEVKVVMDMDNMTSFDFVIANPWHYKDPETTFKYSDSKLFDVGNRVHVEMGYVDRRLPMVAGIITKLSPKFPESGPPTIAVSGQDNLVKLRDKKPGKGDVKYYTKKKDWQIAQVVAARNKLAVKVTEDGPEHPIVVQRNQDDATFLMERAKRIDFDCYIDVDPATDKDTLFFVKPSDGRASSQRVTYVFEWGKSLVSFTPELTAARQVSRVTVKGWDARKKASISATATKADLAGKKSAGTSGPEVAEKKLDEKEEVVVDWPVQTQEEAKALAVSLLRERAYEFLKGTGQAIGLPDMRPGDNVEIKGIGLRFSGQYYVTRVEHAIGNNGYTTGFTVRRSWDGGTKEGGK